MLNKFILEGTVKASAKQIPFTEFFEVRLATSTWVRLVRGQQQKVDGELIIHVPAYLCPDRLQVGDYIYTEATILPAGSLGKKQKDPVFWTNVIHQISVRQTFQEAV